MGLPEIIFEFRKKAESIIARSGNGVVALILSDDTNTTLSYSFLSLNDVTKSHFTTANYDYLQKTFLGSPKKVIVERIKTTDESYDDALQRLSKKKFNYLAIPGLSSDDVETISDWVIEQRTENKQRVKAVLPNSASDNEGIINFTTNDIKVGAKTYTTEEYCCRIAGILAGTPLSQSATYAVLDEVESITESTTPDTDIDSGKLILINDGEKIKIGRAVNSLQTISEGKTEDMKKIKIVEGMDIIVDDIITVFEDEYIGKVSNGYDNKQLFIASVQTYLNDLAADNVLYSDFDNVVSIDLDKQKEYLNALGKDVENMTEDEIKKANTGSKLFVSASLQFEDAMEDLTFGVTMN